MVFRAQLRTGPLRDGERAGERQRQREREGERGGRGGWWKKKKIEQERLTENLKEEKQENEIN